MALGDPAIDPAQPEPPVQQPLNVSTTQDISSLLRLLWKGRATSFARRFP